jgi:hypothetical protein
MASGHPHSDASNQEQAKANFALFAMIQQEIRTTVKDSIAPIAERMEELRSEQRADVIRLHDKVDEANASINAVNLKVTAVDTKVTDLRSRMDQMEARCRGQCDKTGTPAPTPEKPKDSLVKTVAITAAITALTTAATGWVLRGNLTKDTTVATIPAVSAPQPPQPLPAPRPTVSGP